MGASGVVAPPSGAVSFLFTDVEGSTRRWEQAPDQMRVALEAHDAILRSSIAAQDGFVFSTAGDAFAAAFQSPAEAVEAAAGAQRDLQSADWPEGEGLRVRMGVHTGVAQQRDDDYFGPTLNRAARLMSAAHGGQAVVSAATKALVDEVPLLDLGEHRLKDLSEPEHVWQLLIEGLATEFPPLRTLDAVPGNLPVSLASFIGREADIEALMAALEGNRLVTMTGVGGVGKTRLSLQVAADASHHYPQGVWFVELAPVRIGDAVPFQFLETLALEAEPGQSPLQTVAHGIGDGSVLLVVDNCEHVLEPAAAAIAELLGACPNLRVLASSRRTLGVAGEQVRPIQPLDASGANNASTQLFLDRAASADQSKDLTDRLDVVADICARLDGVPLAIELAAARTRSMTPEDLASRLDERFRLLKGARSADGEERHKTLLSTIEWSHDLLDDDQKLLFERLSVFAGAFTLEAAEQICADDDLDEFDIVDLVDDLVDQSLLIADTSAKTARFRMLETIREFAGQQLGDQLTVLRDRHADYHGSWAERIGRGIRSSREAAALAELETGWADLRAAAVHATGDLDLMARLLGPLAMDALWRFRLEFGDWARAALTIADLEGATNEARAVFLGCSATVRGMAGDTVPAIDYGTQLAELCETTSTRMPLQVAAPVTSALILAGDVELAGRLQGLAEIAVVDSQESWAPALTASTRSCLATYSGEPEIAKQAIDKAIELEPADYCVTLQAFSGWLAAMNSEAPRAEVVAQMERVVEQASEVRSTLLSPIFRQYLSSVRAELGDLSQAMADAADNLEDLLATQTLGPVTGAVRRAAVLLIKAGRNDIAAQLLGWVDSQDANPITHDLAAEMEELVPQMRAALSEEAAAAARSLVGMVTEDAVTLAVDTLRGAVDEMASRQEPASVAT